MADNSAVAVAEQMGPNSTHPQPKGEELPPRRFEKLLSSLNREDLAQTHIVHGDGTSALRMNLGQFFVSPPPLTQRKEFFRAIQKWEGYVTAVGEETFWARITPIVGEGPDQDAEIYIEEVSPDDVSLIEPGAVFYWSIGYLDRSSGRLRASILRFRRLPTWAKRELAIAEAEADKIKGLFD